MANNWPLGDKELKIGILGFTEGNAHPYSWSAMYNDFNMDAMLKGTQAEYPAIPGYLGKQPKNTIGVPGARITHVCCTGFKGKEEAEMIAKAANIPNVCTNPEEMIGQVDAVICATDIGAEHVERCRPFMEANIPMFIDKPMVDNEEDLRTFVKWHDEGKHFLSSSSMRYSKAMEPFYTNHYELGDLMYICQPMAKKYETYGIHAVESIYPLLGQGFESVQNTGTYERAMVHLYHKNGCYVDIAQGYGQCGYGTMILGNKGSVCVQDADSYYSFKKQMDKFVEYLRTGERPNPFEDTIEMMKIIIGGLKSREEGGRKVLLSEIKER